MKKISLTLSLIALLIFPFQKLFAQMDPVSFQISEIPEQVEAGESFNVVIDASIEGDWHLYSVNLDPDAGPFPTEIELKGDGIELASDVTESEPIIAFDPNFDAEVGWFSDNATFTVPVRFKKGAASNKVEIAITYQVCNDKYCLPPKTKTVNGTVEVAGQGQAVNTADAGETGSAAAIHEQKPEQQKKKNEQEKVESASAAASGLGGSGGIFSFLWIAILAGFTALLTPCVFPMIPLTVSFFSKKNDSHGKQGFGEAVIFGLAIVATFTLLGALLALFVGVSGANRFASNPWVNLFIGGVLIVFAISLLGAFEIRLPYQVTNWLNRKSNEGSGVTGILFMALTISAVSFSCTAPFVGGVLAATAGGEWFYPILGMIGFSTAFASPFVIFALFPGWMDSLPQSGSWMNVVKVLLGFIELAAAIKFISNADLVWGFGLISHTFGVAFWIVIFMLAGLYTLGFLSLQNEKKPKQITTGRLMLSIPFLLFSFYLIPGLFGSSLGIWDAWLPPQHQTDNVTMVADSGGLQINNQAAEDVWSNSYEASLAAAKEKGTPVFIDFTGWTCTNCRAMETNVFPLANVQNRFEKMELVRLYTDAENHREERQKIQLDLTGTLALPTYAIVNPQNGEVLAQISGYTDKGKFLEFLNDGLQKFNQFIEDGNGDEPYLGSLEPVTTIVE